MVEFVDFTEIYKRMNSGEVPQDMTIFTCINKLRDNQNEIVKEVNKINSISKYLEEIKEIQQAIAEKANIIIKQQEKGA